MWVPCSIFAPLSWSFRRYAGPVGERHRPAAANHGRNDMIESLVVLRGVIQLQLRTQPNIHFVYGLNTSNQRIARKIFPGALQPFHQHHGIHESFQADETRAIRGSRLSERAPVQRNCL